MSLPLRLGVFAREPLGCARRDEQAFSIQSEATGRQAHKLLWLPTENPGDPGYESPSGYNHPTPGVRLLQMRRYGVQLKWGAFPICGHPDELEPCRSYGAPDVVRLWVSTDMPVLRTLKHGVSSFSAVGAVPL
jgi:hypothetical protein